MAFAPAVAETEHLWTTLRLRQASFEDCLEVIRTIARKRGTLGSADEGVMLDTTVFEMWLGSLSTHKGLSIPVV